MKLAGHKILITGAGTGMGLEAARRFAAAGSTVIMVARNEARLHSEAEPLEHAIAFTCDITDERQVGALLEFLDAEHPDLDVVFLNAGVTHTYRLFHGENTLAHAELEMRTNYLSAIRLIEALAPKLGRQADPALIITTSGVAFAPDITNPTYSASKAALHSLTQAVRLQLQRDGSKLKVFEFLAPLVDTPFSAGVTSDQKMPAQTAVDELMAGLERDELELLVGGSRQAYEALRESPDAAVQAINAFTGG